MHIEGLDHRVLTVREINRIGAFYAHVLGCEEVRCGAVADGLEHSAPGRRPALQAPFRRSGQAPVAGQAVPG